MNFAILTLGKNWFKNNNEIIIRNNVFHDFRGQVKVFKPVFSQVSKDKMAKF